MSILPIDPEDVDLRRWDLTERLSGTEGQYLTLEVEVFGTRLTATADLGIEAVKELRTKVADYLNVRLLERNEASSQAGAPLTGPEQAVLVSIVRRLMERMG